MFVCLFIYKNRITLWIHLQLICVGDIPELDSWRTWFLFNSCIVFHFLMFCLIGDHLGNFQFLPIVMFQQTHLGVSFLHIYLEKENLLQKKNGEMGNGTSYERQVGPSVGYKEPTSQRKF